MFVVFEVCQTDGVFLVHPKEVGNESHEENRVEETLENRKE